MKVEVFHRLLDRVCAQLTLEPCRVLPLENGQMLVRFLGEASAITPGQSAVFYDGQRVLGGAFIASQRGIFKVIAEHPF